VVAAPEIANARRALAALQGSWPTGWERGYEVTTAARGQLVTQMLHLPAGLVLFLRHFPFVGASIYNASA
jgi:hypothetical protein